VRWWPQKPGHNAIVIFYVPYQWAIWTEFWYPQIHARTHVHALKRYLYARAYTYCHTCPIIYTKNVRKYSLSRAYFQNNSSVRSGVNWAKFLGLQAVRNVNKFAGGFASPTPFKSLNWLIFFNVFLVHYLFDLSVHL
jgi:hypothetical protein